MSHFVIMKLFSRSSTKTPWRSAAAKGTAIGFLSLLGLTTSWLPIVPLSTSAVKVARAEESKFTRYVRAAFDIEKQRRALIAQVKELTDGNVPSNVCQPSGLEQLSGDIRGTVSGICQNFQAFAGRTISRQDINLTPEEFNAFQRQANKPEMRKQIAEEIKRLNLK